MKWHNKPSTMRGDKLSKFTIIILILIALDLVGGGMFSDFVKWSWMTIWGVFIVFLIFFHFFDGSRKHEKNMNKNKKG